MSHLESKGNQWQDWGVMGVAEKKNKQSTMLAPVENSSKVMIENNTSLRALSEGYSRVGLGFQPALKADHQHCPTKCETRNSNSNIKEHHYVYTAYHQFSVCGTQNRSITHHHSPDAWQRM